MYTMHDLSLLNYVLEILNTIYIVNMLEHPSVKFFLNVRHYKSKLPGISAIKNRIESRSEKESEKKKKKGF